MIVGRVLIGDSGAWCKVRVDYVTKRLAYGDSASMIARQLGGCSRNAVIGIIHRRGLSGRRPKINRTSLNKKQISRVRFKRSIKPIYYGQAPKPKLKPSPIYLHTTMDSGCVGKVSHEDLRSHHCQWPYGDPKHGNLTFCGSEKVAGRSWCQEHCDRARPADDDLSPATNSTINQNATR